MKCSKCGFAIPRDINTCTRCGTPVIKKGFTPTRYIKEDFEDGPALSFSPGDSFGDRYRLVEEIGRGGMGKIYKAWDKELEIHVAIKMIHPELLSKPDTMTRFKKEILIAREITHENVVRIYDFGEMKGIKFISMQYIDGENLAELIHSSGTLSIETAIKIARQICRGMKAAHKQNIIHRDLKPQNIMIDKNGKVFITDFGLAKSLEDAGLSMSGIVMGTPQYLSPEQAMGERADQRSDIYMLGIIMYEMLTGKELFFSETVIGYLQKHIQQKPTSPSTLNLLIPPFFEKIILKCLEKEKSKRYRDVDELLRDLHKEKVASGTIFLSARSRRILKYIALTSLIVIAVAASFYYFFLRKPGPPSGPLIEDNRKSVAVMPFAISAGKKELGHWRETFQDLLNTELCQSKYFRVLSGRRLYEILKEMGILEKRIYTPGDLREVSARGKVNHIIDGKLIEMGKGFHVNVKIWDVASESEKPFKFKPVKNVESFPELVDKIGKKIRETFLSPEERRTDFDEDIGKITTTSHIAYKYYLEGKKFYWDSKYQESNEALEKAVKSDPKFAMAYRRLAVNHIDTGKYKMAKEYLQKALEFDDRVSERERYLIRVLDYKILKNSCEKALETCKELLRNYPDDEEGKIILGSIYRSLEDWEEAEEQYKNILETNKTSWFANTNLAYIYMVKGEFEKARDLMQKNRHLFSNRPTYHRYLTYIYFYQKEYTHALSEIKESQKISTETDLDPNILLMGIYHHLNGNLSEAEKYYKQLMEADYTSTRSSGHLWMCRLYLTTGKYNQSKEAARMGIKQAREAELEAAESKLYLYLSYIHLRLGNGPGAFEAAQKALKATGDISPTEVINIRIFALHLQGRSYILTANIEKAKETASQLSKLIGKSGIKRQRRLYYLLMGNIARAENKVPDAIKLFEQALPLLSNQVGALDDWAFYIEPLGTAYLKTGNLKKAEELFKTVQSLSVEKLRWGDIYARSFYRLGKIYQDKGEEEKAISQYKIFIGLWKNADRNIPTLVDAKHQLAVLE
ncbi:MAG: protein kinase [Candidatus Aminicenantes bacterium]|nr:protein kinase [Candidatus Aminicenantes bacterium]